MGVSVRLRVVDFEWYEPSMGESSTYKAVQLSAYLLMLARDGFMYEVDRYDSCIVLADRDIDLPEAVSEEYYDFLHYSDEDTTRMSYDGVEYIFERVRDTVE